MKSAPPTNRVQRGSACSCRVCRPDFSHPQKMEVQHF
jgi:hypothetical protein